MLVKLKNKMLVVKVNIMECFSAITIPIHIIQGF